MWSSSSSSTSLVPSSLVPSSTSLVPSSTSLVPSSTSLVPSSTSLDTSSSSSLDTSSLDTSSLNTPSSTEPIVNRTNCQLNDINVKQAITELATEIKKKDKKDCKKIKDIYRNNIKSVHPDRNLGCKDEAVKVTQEFNNSNDECK